MKNQIKQLQKTLDSLREKHELMDDKFWSRSDTWQDSEKGEEFQDKMSELEDCINELECIIERLEEL